MKKFSSIFALAAVVTVALPFALSAADSSKQFAIGNGIAVAGYDVISYFPEGGGKPTKGSFKITSEHQGLTYRFASEKNKTAFVKNPGQYVPAYGGWCAYALAALDANVDIDPLSYEIRDGRLYLFYRDNELDTRALWRKSPSEFITKANANWKGSH